MLRTFFSSFSASFLLFGAYTPVHADSLNLLAFGDSGTGDKGQYALAEVMTKTCANLGCDAALLLGDNIYPHGALTASDPQFQSKFEKPYRGLEFPFYAVLGNHDVHLGRQGADAQIQYTNHSSKWRMKARHYRERLGHTEIFALDTNTILDDREQQQWLDEALASSDARWKLVIGHHPIYSIGEHGQADAHEGRPQARLRTWLSPLLCRERAVYLSGHDHLVQVNQLPCGSLSIVSGAAGKPRKAYNEAIEAQRDTLRFYHAKTLSFAHLAIRDDELKLTFWDESGNELHSQIVLHGGSSVR